MCEKSARKMFVLVFLNFFNDLAGGGVKNFLFVLSKYDDIRRRGPKFVSNVTLRHLWTTPYVTTLYLLNYAPNIMPKS